MAATGKRRPATLLRGRPRVRILPWLVLLGISAVPVGLVMSPTSAPHADSQTALSLDTDAGSTPLFQADHLTPGAGVTNCIQVRYQGADPGAVLGVYAQVTDAGLADLLTMTVDVGTGGRFGDCTGFVAGATVYHGTLAAFDAAHGTAGTPMTVDSVQGSGSVGFRFAFQLADGAGQGLRAQALFGWTGTQLPPLPVPTPSQSTPDSPSPSADPTPSVSSSPPVSPSPTRTSAPPPAPRPVAPLPTSAAASLPPQPDPSASTGPSPVPTGPGAPGGGTGTGGAGGGRGGGGSGHRPGHQGPSGSGPGAPGQPNPDSPGAALAAAAQKLVSHVLLPAGKAGVLAMSMLVVVGLFLTVQNRIDRRDPKLASAEVHRPADAEFVDRSEIQP